MSRRLFTKIFCTVFFSSIYCGIFVSSATAQIKSNDWQVLANEMQTIVDKFKNVGNDPVMFEATLNRLGLDLVWLRQKYAGKESALSAIDKLEPSKQKYDYERKEILLRGLANALQIVSSKDKTQAPLFLLAALNDISDTRILGRMLEHNNLAHRINIEKRVYGKEPTALQKDQLARAKADIDYHQTQISLPKAMRAYTTLVGTSYSTRIPVPNATNQTLKTPTQIPTLQKTSQTNLRVKGNCKTCPLKGTKCGAACKTRDVRQTAVNITAKNFKY